MVKEFLFAVLLIALGACFCQAAKADGQVRIVDALGRTVIMPRPPQRIVTIFSSNSEIAAALGLMDKIVGVDALVSYPPSLKKKPFVGGRLGFSLEAIVALKPDLVIMAPSRQAVHILLEPLTRLGIPTVVTVSRNLEEILANIILTANICGVPDRGQALTAQMRRELISVKESRVGRSAPRVVMINGHVGSGLLLVTRDGSYTADLIKAAGGILALDENTQDRLAMSQISPEVLLNVDPDIIIYTLRQNQTSELSDIMRRPGWERLAAVRQGTVYTVPSGEFLIPGPRIVDGVKRLSRLFDDWEQKAEKFSSANKSADNFINNINSSSTAEKREQ